MPSHRDLAHSSPCFLSHRGPATLSVSFLSLKCGTFYLPLVPRTDTLEPFLHSAHEDVTHPGISSVTKTLTSLPLDYFSLGACHDISRHPSIRMLIQGILFQDVCKFFLSFPLITPRLRQPCTPPRKTLALSSFLLVSASHSFHGLIKTLPSFPSLPFSEDFLLLCIFFIITNLSWSGLFLSHGHVNVLYGLLICVV